MIYLLFSRSHAVSSMGIRLATWSSFSHVDMVSSQDVLVGTTFMHGTVALPIGRRVDKASLLGLYRIDAPPKNEQRFKDFVWAQIGKPYDLGAIFGLPLRRNFQNTDRWFCSEQMAAAGEHADIPLVRKHSWRVTPQDLWESTRGEQVWVGKGEVKF